MKKALLAGGFVVISLFYTLAQAFESSPIGWASLTDGNAPYTITGGSAGDTVIVTDPTALKNYATSTTPYVILVSGTITMPRGTSANHTETINLESNKTIIGIGSNPGVNGGFNISGKSNIIIRNLNIWYRDSVNQGDDDPWTDGITIQNSSLHIWVDHCNIFDSPDGLIDPTKQSNYLTISWTKFYYTPDGNNLTHRNCCLVGSSDTEYTSRGKLKETFHHNWWSTNCKERMPRVRFGQVHVFNNYYSNLEAGGYCQGVGEEAQIKVENNYYDAVPLPWKDYHTTVWGKIGWNTGNVFSGCTVPTTFPNDYNNIFVPPYSYTLDAGSSINTIVPNGAGVDKLTPSPNPMTFSVAPYAASDSSISMTASTATCDDGVEYYFDCNSGGHDSGWQTSSSYTDTNLTPNTSYTYTVQTRNQTQTIFTGAVSSPASATTLTGGDPPGQASSPTPANGATDVSQTQDLSWTAGSGATSHDVYFGTVNPPPSIGNQAGTTYDTGTMSPNKTYYWRIDEKNGGGTTTGTIWNFTTQADTIAPTPNPMTWASVPTATSSTSISMTATTAADDTGPVQYYFECTTDAGRSSSWQTDTTYAASGLTPSTLYSFRVKARDNAATLNETGWSSTQSATTLAPSPIVGTVTLNSSSSARTSATFSHTVAAGDNRLLTVSVMIKGDKSVSSITYGGTALTKAVSRASGSSSSCATEIWYLVGPTVGTASIVVTFAASTDPSAITAVNFTDVDQSSPIGATASNLATTGTNVTTNITTLNANSLIFGALTNYGGDTDPYTPGSGITELWDSATGTSTSSDVGFWGGDRLAATAGTYTFNATATASDDWTIVAVEIKAAQIITPPGAASSPVPSDDATDVSITQDLSWTAGSGATSHDVYFGTVNPPPSIGNQAGTTYDTGTMSNGTTYYWRIDEKNTDGTTTGTVWNFTTIYKRTLTTSSSSGGSVTTPGEGAFQYDHNTVVNIVAAPSVYYHFVNWTGTGVTAGKVANPASASTTITMDADYTAQANFVIDQNTISGYVTESDANMPLEGVSINASNGGGSDITDINGYYQLTVDCGWSGTATPSKTGYMFEPNSITYSSVTVNTELQNYVGTLLTYKIAGYVKNACLVPIGNVLVTGSLGANSDTTDANGYYEIWVDYNWSGTVTPSKLHYTFDPNSRAYSNVAGDTTAQDYVADNIYDLDCDGTIGWGDIRIIGENWLMTGMGIPGDFDENDTVNFIDFADFATVW